VLEWLVILLLLLANGVLAMSELALASARRIRLEQRAERGDAGAKVALELTANPTRLLSTVQVGITLIGILAGAFGGAALAGDVALTLKAWGLHEEYADALALSGVVVIITYLSLVVGELVPKRLALQNPERVASIVSRPMKALALAVGPVVAILSFSTEVVLRLFGVREHRQEAVSEEEVRGLIQEGAAQGVFHERERELIERVFHLADQRVKALMVPRADIVWIDADATVERVRLIVATSPHSHFPVCEGSLDKLVGVVHVKDLVKNSLITGADVKASELARVPLFVPENTPAMRLLERFREMNTHVAFLVDEFGGVEGLVTLNDLVEAIVGDVAQTQGDDKPGAVRRADGSFLVDGRLPVEDLRRALDVEELPIPETAEAHTAAGLVLALLGHVPRTGEIVERGGLRFEVVDMDRQRVDQILVSRITTVG
jgi:putative hemolysin